MHFLTFGSGQYARYARELANSSRTLGGFESARVAGLEDLDPDFVRRNQKTLNTPRGGGLWIYKSYIILKELLNLPTGGILCYCDSLYLFTDNFTKFALGQLHAGDVAIAQNKPCEGSYMEGPWTKMDVFHALNMEWAIHACTPQSWGGFLLLRKSFDSISFIAKWLTYCEDHRLISDSLSTLCNMPEFIEHRHDQSILSLLAKKHNIKNFVFTSTACLRNLRVPTS
jgi:hypothetical protein